MLMLAGSSFSSHNPLPLSSRSHRSYCERSGFLDMSAARKARKGKATQDNSCRLALCLQAKHRLHPAGGGIQKKNALPKYMTRK